MFADDMAILSTNKNQLTATDNLQMSITNIFAWTKHWKINGDRSVHVIYTLRKTENIQIVLNKISCLFHVLHFLILHLDSS